MVLKKRKTNMNIKFGVFSKAVPQSVIGIFLRILLQIQS